MNPIILIVLGVLSVLIFAIKDIQYIVNNAIYDLDPIYKKYGEIYDLDWKLLKAIARQESSENPRALNPNDPSAGLMQILCSGFPIKCTNKFFIDGWPPTNPALLFDPDYNVKLGAQILRWNVQTFGVVKGIAVYNSWSARTQTQPFHNQEYVDSVLNHYRNLGGRV